MHAQQVSDINNSTTNDTIEKNQKSDILFVYDTSLVETGNSEIKILMPRNKQNDYILPIFLLAILVYFTFLKLQYTRQLQENITVLFNINLAQQIYRDREFSAGIFSLLFMLNFILVFAVLLYHILDYFKFPFFSSNVIVNIAICGGILPFTYFLKSIFYWFAGLLFSFQFEISFFRFNTSVLYQMAGIVLLPLVILASVAGPPVSIWALFSSIGLFALVYLVRVIKGFGIGARFARFHLFYFLLYLCAFEIAPLLIIIKIIGLWVTNS